MSSSPPSEPLAGLSIARAAAFICSSAAILVSITYWLSILSLDGDASETITPAIVIFGLAGAQVAFMAAMVAGHRRLSWTCLALYGVASFTFDVLQGYPVTPWGLLLLSLAAVAGEWDRARLATRRRPTSLAHPAPASANRPSGAHHD